MSHLRLFDWHEKNEAVIKPFLNSLKQVTASFVFKRLALECFARFAHTSVWPTKYPPVFVPAPASHPQKPNHALELAKALAFYFGGEVQPVLNRTTLCAQKKKNRFSRSQIQFDLTRKPEGQAVIFTDDILTSGWTAKKAFKALGSPKNFLICTLAWRRPQLSETSATSFLYHNTLRKKANQKILYLKDFLNRISRN